MSFQLTIFVFDFCFVFCFLDSMTHQQVLDDAGFLDNIISKYIGRIPSYLHETITKSQHIQKIQVIINSFDNSIHEEFILLMLEYYGVGGKWIDMGISKTCTINTGSSSAYNPYKDEYCVINGQYISMMKSYTVTNN